MEEGVKDDLIKCGLLYFSPPYRYITEIRYWCSFPKDTVEILMMMVMTDTPVKWLLVIN